MLPAAARMCMLRAVRRQWFFVPCPQLTVSWYETWKHFDAMKHLMPMRADLSRTLSYEGAEFALGHVAVDEVFKVMYDRATLFWTLLWKIVQCHPRLTKLQGVFWSANQRFWKQLLMVRRHGRAAPDSSVQCSASAVAKPYLIALLSMAVCGGETVGL